VSSRIRPPCNGSSPISFAWPVAVGPAGRERRLGRTGRRGTPSAHRLAQVGEIQSQAPPDELLEDIPVEILGRREERLAGRPRASSRDSRNRVAVAT